MKVIGYARVSTDRQDNSAGAQNTRIRGYAAAHGLELVGIETDLDAFSGDLNRPGIQRILQLVRAKNIDGVVISKLDRLTRSTRDVIDLVELFEKKGVALISIAENLDTKSPIGQFFVQMIAALAELERKIIGTRTREGLQNLKSLGFPAGPAPYGFESQPRTAQEKADRVRKPLLENQREHNIISRIVGLRETGKEFCVIAETLNAEGYRTRPYKGFPKGGKWVASSVQRIYVNSQARKIA